MKSEKEDEELKKIFDSIWFKTLMGFYFEARYWGHSLVQLGDVITTAEGVPAYDNVLLIPLKHVISEYGRVVGELGDDCNKIILSIFRNLSHVFYYFIII